MHVLLGCDVSLNDEMVVKITSFLGTDNFWLVLKGYQLPESKEIYQKIRAVDVVRAIWCALYLIPRTTWRCIRMRKRWVWGGFQQSEGIPLAQLREEYGIRVAH